MAMTAQEYLDNFNTAINAGAYDSAASILKAAEGDFGPGVYNVAGVVLESNPNLPQEIDFMSPQGIQSIRDYVNTATAPPPAPPAVDPSVEEFNSLIRTGNFKQAAEFAQSQGFAPDQVATYINENAANLGLPAGFGVTGENIATLYPGYVAPAAATVAKSFDEQLNELANQNLGRSLTASEMETYRTDFRGELNDANISDFLKRSQTEIDQVKTARDTATKAAETAAANAEGRPGPGQILGIPTLTRQTQSNVPFAPLRRGLAQLRPAMYMPGLTSGQAPLGGSKFTPESLRNAIKSMTAAGQTPADVAYQMDMGGISPAELSAAIGTPVGQIQAQYNQSRPRGLFSTGVPAPRGLPEDFALQTGAYGAPTPTFFTQAPAKTTLPSGQANANANQLGFSSGDGGEVGFSQEESGRGFFGDIAAAANAMGFGSGPGNAAADAAASSTASSVSGTGSPGDDNKEGGLIRMAEGGGPPKMAELSAKEAGSTFNIADYINDQGQLVGGYSKPIYDENRVITGYEYKPYERDVVFGEELRGKEAAMRLTDAERKQMMIEMAMRQGRTGIDPRAGGLAGIEIGDPMMRRRPQYYSPTEQFRPRYAEGGNVSSTAQDLASRGRGGDTMLVHMAPHEVAGLNEIARMQGTELTINPETGMPEALKLGKLFKTLAPFIPFIPGVGQFLAPAFGALGMGGFSPLLQKAITSGVVGGFSGPKGGFDLQRGLMQGITAYGLGSLQQNLAGPSTPGGPPTPTGPTVSSEFGAVDSTGVDFANLSGADLAGATTPPASVAGGTSSVGTDVFNPSGIDQAGASITETVNPNYGTYSDTAGGIQTQPRVSIAPEAPPSSSFSEPMKTPTALLTTGFGLSSIAESDKLASAQMAAQREKEEEEDLYRRLFESTLGQVRTAKAGGLMKLAGGGMSYMEAGGTTGPTGAPRDVTGTGDGMSDSVPASIEGVQEARLADGEFVIPADVVADIGNGSSDAGSKKLYDMMDRIRKARHGTTEQPPEIQAERLMPA